MSVCTCSCFSFSLCYTETSSPAFDEFLQCIGHKVQLRDFDRYRGGLDIKGIDGILTLLS